MLQQQIEGKYELLGRFEDEGGAEVYKVRHLFLDEVRLIKAVHPPGLAMSQEVTERFLREARAAIKLRHPNIAQLHDFTIDAEGTAFIVTELIEGLTLEEALAQEGPPPVALTLAVAQQALHALGYLHRARMVHRDISPGKLMLTRDVDGQALVKWVDLGTAQVLAAGEGLPAGAGGLPPKPRYASPEQFSGEGAADARGDLYSFGVVLYELLTGRCPIAGHDPFSWMVGHLSTPPLPFEDTDPEGRVPDDLREVVLSTLAKKPEERVASAAELARRLARLQALPEDDGAYLERVARRAGQRQATVMPAPMVAAPVVVAPAVAAKAAPAKAAPGKAAAVPGAAASPPAVLPRGTPPPAAPVPVEPRHVESPARLWEPISSPSEPRPANLAWDQQNLTTQSLRIDPALPGEKPNVPGEPPAPAPADEEPRRSRPTAVLLGGGLLIAGALVGLGWWFGGSRQAEEPVPVQAATPAPTPSPLPPPTVETVIVQEAPPPQEPEPLPGMRSAAERDRRRERPLVSLPYIPPSDPGSSDTPQDTAKLIVPGPGFEAPEAQTPPKPVYPEAARGTGRQPAIKVAVLVDQNGNVVRARVTDGDRSQFGFNEAARAAAMRVRFFPATKNGVPGMAWTDLICTFEDPGAPAPAPPPSPPVVAVPPPVRPPGLSPSPPPAEIPTEETVAPEPIATEPPL